MRFIKRLLLQGYKTFASPTEFVFDAGVTAIVGPNGSGKSNVADSLRWVLGEQSYGALRGKRTEDMIFSGSEQRPRLGMAYVALAFDNTMGWLPIDFSEVEIARRAYRSGENEYYLNGNRVRLRDITELLGTSGLSERTYTVIGQGLVDQALSQRPEERRKLFEEAAGITVYQSKREQAAQRMAEAQTNLTRARDITNELTPRLRYLRGQARRAQEYQQIKRDLDAQLELWYGYRWRQALVASISAKERAADSISATEEQGEALGSLLEQIVAKRNERAALRDELSEWHRVSSQLHLQAETVQRELAVRSEQLRLWGEQQEEHERELMLLLAAIEDGTQRRQAVEAERASSQATHQARLARLAAAGQELNVLERERQAWSGRLAEDLDAVLAMKTQLAEQRSRLSQIQQRRAELARSDLEQAQATQNAELQLAELETQTGALAQEMSAVEGELATLAQAREAQTAALAAAQQAEREALEALNLAQRAFGRLQDQYDMLARLRDEGTGLAGGPRAILSARQHLGGIVGILGELIEVPAELERAIAAAMGSRLQDIVVRRWEDAEAAITFLKEKQAGRATFLPLDTLRPPRATAVPRVAGVLGLASRLVKFDGTIKPAVELALNHILVVQDLPTARHLLRVEDPLQRAASESPGARDGGGGVTPTLVTLEGEIVRPSGSVTGGSDSGRRDGGLLVRARTLRELPDKMDHATAQVTRLETRVAEARAGQQSARATIEVLRAERGELVASQERLLANRNRLQLALESVRQTRAWHESRRQDMAAELAALDGRESQIGTAISDLSSQIDEKEANLEVVRRELAALATDHLVTELAHLQAEVAVSASQQQSYEARVEELARLQQDRTREVAAKEERIRSLAAMQLEATRAISQQETIGGALAQQIANLAAQIDPAETRLTQSEREQRVAETQERSLRDELRHAQMRQSQAELALQRAEDELAHLRREIEKDLGLVAFSTSDGLGTDELVDGQPPLPLDGMVTRLPAVVELPEGLDDDVRNLRAQLARLGPVNLDALSEYQEVEARYSFLTSQSADLEKAVASLEAVIQELDRVMEREFLATFKAVAAAFKEEFRELFGGGTARLVLSDPENPGSTGVEIIARPPGKREQGLALLSGGERALTAAALIFSILKSRPTPFCVLDEVDAMLDEANVGRFRDALTALCQQTQFILVTHNRGTIEIADTIYGVSMGADNTSQVLSLKLHGRQVVPANIAEVD